MQLLFSEKRHLRVNYGNGKIFVAALGDTDSKDGQRALAAIAKLRQWMQQEGIEHDVYQRKNPSDPKKKIDDTIILQLG